MQKRYYSGPCAAILVAAAMTLLMPAASLAGETGKAGITGSLTTEAIQSNNSNSSKFNEYRDIDDSVSIDSLNLESNAQSGRYFEFHGNSILRDDKNILAEFGRLGSWGLNIEWDEIPHLLSNKAQTPYLTNVNGILIVPKTVPEVYPAMLKELAPANTAGGLTGNQKQQANDLLTEGYLDQYLHPTSLENQRQKGSMDLNFTPSDFLTFQVGYTNEDRDGSKVTYGPIGDRPPRSLNIQLAEPIDYQTTELNLDAEYAGKNVQFGSTYTNSNFENSKSVLTWQNIYTEPALAPDGTYEAWGGATPRNVATYGRRPLPQDNDYQNLSFSYGVGLPMNSRLSASVDYSSMTQDEALTPYSTNGTLDTSASGDGLAWNDPAKLPRRTAEGEIKTSLINLNYALNPGKSLSLRSFYRFYDLENNTPTDDWRYVTQDTTGTTGSVSYLNKRSNLAYEYDKKNFGLDGSYSFPFWSSVLNLGFEKEEINREFREADTDEDIYHISFRSRPTSWFNSSVKFKTSDRNASVYDGEAAHESYWYAPADKSDNIDSQFTFENHPDTRRFDVTDRKRKEFDMMAAINSASSVDISVSYRFRKNDYNSHVTPSQPLLHYAGAIAITNTDRNAYSPGDQVGLLGDELNFYGLDFSYSPSERLSYNAYANREDNDSMQRGFEFDENFKANPSAAVATSELGPWTRKSMQWTAMTRDAATTYGLGTNMELRPEKLDFSADINYMSGKTSILYDGFGTYSSVTPGATLADNYQFGFRSPVTVRNDRVTLNTKMDYKLTRKLVASLGYTYERYKLKDWQQDTTTPWYATVNGNEFIVRDTSLSNQWGNRLPNMGSYLAPSYKAHVLSLAFSYSF